MTEYLAAVPEERYLELAAAGAAQRHLFMFSAEKSGALSAVDVALGTTCQCAPWLLPRFTGLVAPEGHVVAPGGLDTTLVSTSQ